MTALFDRFLGAGPRLPSLTKKADKVLALDGAMRRLSDPQLPEALQKLRARARDGEALDTLLPDTFALTRETARRVLGEHPFPVQIMGGIALHEGNIAEMKTGEGKTLVATMPVVLNALAGEGVHVVTVNEYLAKRDAEWMGKVYRALGLTVGVSLHGQTPEEKRAAYAADITYGTNNEFGFDYLRDNMAYRTEQKAQRGLHYAIVDEVDSILIDEARTPLIISAPDEESSRQYAEFARIVPRLERNVHFEVDEKQHAVTLTDEGISKMEELLGVGDLYGGGEIRQIHHLEQALRAHVLYKRDVDYVVKDGEVIIVDSFTGRLMPGRRYSEGLHQAIEAKEGVRVQQESRTLATITFQNYFRLYGKLAGMTGTAETSKEEFQKVYNLDVLVIPTNKHMIREDLSDRVYASELGKFKNVVREIKRHQEKGQPVLVGTIAIEKSELLSNMLKREGVPHEVLNAKNHAHEADIVARAGQKGAVTISTNMAGRGTDIKLGDGVRELGGLHVVGTERHEARRIDNQLRGRSGRQGDPGSSQFFISTEDDVMRIFGADRMKRVLERMKVPEDEPIESGLVSKAVEAAQAKVEGFYFDSRKHVLDYDDVMNKQRGAFYRTRTRILESQEKPEDLRAYTTELLGETLAEAVHTALIAPAPQSADEEGMPRDDGEYHPEDHARKAVERFVHLTDAEWSDLRGTLPADLSGGIPDAARAKLGELVERHYATKEASAPLSVFADVVRGILLRALDTLWTDHLETMEYLRTGIGLRGYGQRDPLVEYRREGHQLFQNLLASFRQEATAAILHLTIHAQAPAAEKRAPAAPDRLVLSHPTSPAPTGAVGQETDLVTPAGVTSRVDASPSQPHDHAHAARAPIPHAQPVREKAPVGRNDPCPCGSGKKYKKCHGK
jgi:preprotein translocase subunit SecA